MRRPVVLVGAWLLAGAAAVGAGTVAVSMVGRQVTDSRPASLSAEEVAQQLSAQPSSTASPDTSTTSSTAAQLPTPTTTVPADPGVIQPTDPTTPPTVATTAPPPAPAETRSYALVGGNVTIRFSATGASVVTANPAPGFEVDVEPEHGNGVKVEFESEGHKSRLTAWWDAGPRDEVREEPDS